MTTPEAPAKKRAIYQGILLGGFATFATALIAIGNMATHNTIDKQQANDMLRSLSQVIPPALHDNNVLDDKLTFKYKGKDVIMYCGTKNKKPVGFAFDISGEGYGGKILMVMGVDTSGKILGVRILSHSETPGLGDKIETDKTHWLFSFNGLSFAKVPKKKWRVKKDGGIFDQFSGATITPRAVVKAITEGLSMFDAHRAQLIAMASAKTAQNKTKDTTTHTAPTSPTSEAATKHEE